MTLAVQLSHGFHGFDLDLDFEVPARGVTALFGPSGSGKTTCANAVAGLLRPRAGRISLRGEVLSDSTSSVFVPARRRRIGTVFQDARLFPHLSVAGNLDYGARRSPEPRNSAERARILAMLGIEGLLDRRPRGLSGGEAARVALGRALLAGPRLLILDEPLAALDAPRRAEILPYLERLRDEAGMPILFVSHSLDEVTRLADRMVVLNRGQVAASGSVEDIMARLDLFPLTGRFEAGAVIAGTVSDPGANTRLGRIAFSGGALTVPPLDLPAGAAIRLRVRARDVMVATEAPKGLSARNILPVRVSEIRAEKGPYVELRLECGGTAILSRITAEALADLGLAPGDTAFAVIKTVTIARASASGRPSG
ncbi:MAG: molybdenum ABC transporter ATP-binding protein [Pseudomonadota bacterium]